MHLVSGVKTGVLGLRLGFEAAVRALVAVVIIIYTSPLKDDQRSFIGLRSRRRARLKLYESSGRDGWPAVCNGRRPVALPMLGEYHTYCSILNTAASRTIYGCANPTVCLNVGVL